MSYLLAFAGFAALIILHEFGHFVAAKAVGMRVERFALFFPPLLARWRPRNSETEYGLGAIPLGGYVKITGMNPEEDMPPEVAHRAYYRQKVWKRIVVIAAGPAVNIVLAFVILWVLFASRPLPLPQPVVQTVEKGTAAQGVLQPGDRLVSVDGRPGYAPGLTPEQGEERVEALREQIARHSCAGEPRQGCAATEPVKIVVLRDGERRTLEVTPRYDEQADRLLIGFGFGTRGVDVGVGEAAEMSVTGMWNVTTITVDRIVRLFYDEQARNDVSGVVGSYEVTRQSLEFDTVRAVSILALISLSLGIINLFPFLPLDGGHIFWALAEKLRGRAISFRVLERASVVGFMLVLFLFYVGLSNDIGRLSSGEGFGVR
ncbi:MAG TPA: M50 family metallopeptidase [Solirubrobacteraceae bacterium]|nr:M50 family metallopeptidase [Solirubrobacteraceae bacterium]